MAGLRRGLELLALAGALAGCAWLPWSRDEEAAPAETAEEVESAPADKTSTGPCTRKGRSWPEGSRVCEDHAVTRCFSDGVWRVIGSC
jgi:hypothetical protein